ncbi:hypothetical protein [Faecalicatena orotica]|uniref:hypothetical protein n=1 Tax=Faecalicatena orotica TaxID=1544 RepID=UPI003216F2B8
MQELEKMINIYHTGFTVCLILACIFFAVSCVLFFRFNIRGIIDMKTGRGAKKTIQKMEEINAKTGKLRQDMVSHTPSSLSPEERISYPVTAPNLNVQAEARVQGSTGVHQESVHAGAQPGQITEPLGGDGSQETTLLYQSEETTVLSQNLQKQAAEPEVTLPGPFKIIKETMWVHTEEVL